MFPFQVQIVQKRAGAERDNSAKQFPAEMEAEKAKLPNCVRLGLKIEAGF